MARGMSDAEMVRDLDRLCAESRDMNLSPGRLVELHAQIAGIRYALADMMVRAEKESLMAEEGYESHCIQTRLMLQAKDERLSTAKATDMVEGEASTEKMRLGVIEKKAKHQHIKHRLNASNDILISLSIRLKLLKQEWIDNMTEKNF